MNLAIAIAYFFIASLSDKLSIQWHRAREEGRSFSGANLSILLAILGWAPLVLFITNANWEIIVADLLGNWVGSYWGIEKYRENTN